MASRTDLYPSVQRKKIVNKRLRDITAVIYNYIKAKPISSRSASEQILFQQACSVTEHFTLSDRLVLLRTTPATRNSLGPPEPSARVLRDFKTQQESFLFENDGTSPSPSPPPGETGEKMLSEDTKKSGDLAGDGNILPF